MGTTTEERDVKKILAITGSVVGAVALAGLAAFAGKKLADKDKGCSHCKVNCGCLEGGVCTCGSNCKCDSCPAKTK